MSLAALARKTREKRKASQGRKCFITEMSHRGKIISDKISTKDICCRGEVFPGSTNTQRSSVANCQVSYNPAGCEFGPFSRPIKQNSYRNHLKKITAGSKVGVCVCSRKRVCTNYKCSPDKSASEIVERRKQRVVDASRANIFAPSKNLYACSKSNNICKSQPQKFIPVYDSSCNRSFCNKELSRIYVKKHWCQTTKNLGMQSAGDYIQRIKARRCNRQSNRKQYNPANDTYRTFNCDCIKTSGM